MEPLQYQKIHMSSHLNQSDLLNEGLWNAIKAGARLGKAGISGAVRGGLKAIDKVVPELAAPYKKLASDVGEIAGAAKQGASRAFKGLDQYVIDQLEDLGYLTKPGEGLRKTGKKFFIIPAYKIKDYDASGKPIVDWKHPSPFLVNKQGVLVKNLKHAKAQTGLS